ncbi:MAG: hypothetical protein ABFC67_04495 [Mizugakiibacter sp.]|uniref:hypothetical protein n=1 Tax=Mizugakiibacter sp. TaxID=1972610 RepID=UPI0031C537D6|nr:hypothetical protein [Xanthomonadaceae bacterium]
MESALQTDATSWRGLIQVLGAKQIMGHVFGIVLIAVGSFVIIVGGKAIRTKGGIVSKVFSIPRFHAVVVKWAFGLLCIWFGVALLLGAMRP